VHQKILIAAAVVLVVAALAYLEWSKGRQSVSTTDNDRIARTGR